MIVPCASLELLDAARTPNSDSDQEMEDGRVVVSEDCTKPTPEPDLGEYGNLHSLLRQWTD